MKVQTKWYLWWILLPAMCLLWGSNSYHRPQIVEKLERLAYDRHLHQLAEPQLHPEIVLVMAGEESLTRLGRWPWPRSIHAGLLDKLSQAQTVILDILFPEPSRTEDDIAFVSSAKRIHNLVLAMHLSPSIGARPPQVIEPFQMLSSVSPGKGFTNMETDSDGLVRYCKPYREINDRVHPSLPLAAAYAILGGPAIDEQNAVGEPQQFRNAFQIPVDSEGKLWINHGKSDAKIYEYYQVLNGEVPPEAFNGKIVLVGVSASGIEDFFKIPSEFGSREITGTQLNASIIKSLVSEMVPRRVHPLIDGILAVMMVVAGAALTKINRPIWNFVSLIILAIAALVMHQHLFVTKYTYTALIVPLSGMVGAFSIFLFFKLKLIHQESEIKTFSISSIIGLPQDFDQKARTYDEYLLSIWKKIEMATGIHLISARIKMKDVQIPALADAASKNIEDQDNVILLEDRTGSYKHMAMIPISSDDPAAEQEYTVLGWQRQISESHIQSIMAVVISTAWYFERVNQAEQQKKMLFDTIHAISAAVDAKDHNTGGHSNRVSKLALEISEQLNIGPKERDNIFLGALIHDIGKVGVSDSILAKQGKLTREEFAAIQGHPSVGKKIMSAVKLPDTTLRAMYEHHERWDGSGYPLGLKGNQINMAGRIIAVADVFDALVSERPYRAAMPLERALSYMKKKSGSLFDETIVNALIDVFEKEPLNRGIVEDTSHHIRQVG